MNSNIINRDSLINMLEENGVIVTISNGKVTAVSVKDPNTNFSYSVTDGELKLVHLQDENLEIFFEDASSETVFKIVKGRKMHSAIIAE